MRTFTVTKATQIGEIIDARFKGPQAAAAMAELKAFNPHVDFDKLTPGVRLFVPDRPAFRTAATATVTTDPLQDLRSLVSDALGEALDDLRVGAKTRAAEREEVNAVLKSAAIKRQIDSDPVLAQQAADARKGLADEDAADKSADDDLQSIGKAALAALADLQKQVG